MKLQIVPIDSAMLAALFVLVLSGCASANLNPEEERRLQQDHAELNRQVVAGYKGSGVAPPSGTQSEHRVPTATSRRTTVSVIGTEPSSLVSEIMQGTMVFYRQTGRWPTSREEVELGLKQLPKFLHTAHVVLKNKGDHLMVEFSADDGLRGSLTVRTPR